MKGGLEVRMKAVVFPLLICILVSILTATFAEANQKKEGQGVWRNAVKYLKSPKPKVRPEIVRWKPFATTIYLGTLKNCGTIIYPARPRYRIEFPSRALYNVAITPYWGTMTAFPSRPWP